MTDKENSNLDLWSQVEETDPNFTKHVGQRGGFTAISAHYQIKQATRLWGPVGSEWGYTVEYNELSNGVILLQAADVTVWYPAVPESNKALRPSFGPVRGLCAVVNNKGRLDEDAGKKAMTDALTKALSHLGFSADVFMGLFDDNRYVAELKSKFSGEGAPAAKEPVEIPMDKLVGSFQEAYEATKDFLRLENSELNDILKERGLPFDRDWERGEFSTALKVLKDIYRIRLEERKEK